MLQKVNQIFTSQNESQIEINNIAGCQYWIQQLKSHCDEFSVLGFHCNYMTKKTLHTVGVLQLASYQGLCLQIQLYDLQEVPFELKRILEDDSIVKVGFNPHSITKYLVQDYNTFVASTLDVRIMAASINQAEVLNRKIKRKREIISAQVNVNLFKLFAEQLQPKGMQEKEITYVQRIISDYCREHIGTVFHPSGLQTKEPIRIMLNEVEKRSSLMQVLKSHCKEYCVLGFDWKWRPLESIALLQLTSYRGVCIIISLQHLSMMPPELKEILQDDKIIKVGFNPMNIDECLFRNYNIDTASMLDIRYMADMAKSVTVDSEKMFEIYLGKCYKQRLRTLPNWTEEKWTNPEKKYAARVSYAAIELFKCFAVNLKPNISFEEQPAALTNQLKDYFDINYDNLMTFE